MSRMTQRSGQSTIEIVVALGILAAALGAAIMMTLGGQSLTLTGGQLSVALRLAREDMEQARADARSNFAGLGSASSTLDGFTREILVQTLDANRKLVTSRVSWDVNILRAEQVELVTLVTNARDVLGTGGDTGGGGTSGDWQDPQTLGAADLGPGNAATGLDVFQGMVYLTAQASDTKKPDFFIVDAANGQSPVIAGQVDTGDGLLSVDFADGVAFVGNSSTTAQLQVMNVSNPSAPSVQADHQLPGVSGNGAVGRSIFYLSEKIYIGTNSASGPEFHIVDVSNLLNPQSLGSFEVGADVNSIRVLGHLAYLATSGQELMVLDVADPNNIEEVGGYNASGAADGLSLHQAGSTLYLGRENANQDDELLVLDVTDPSSVDLLGSQEIGVDVNGIQSRDDLVFIATSDSNKEFQVWNASDPADIIFWSSFNFPQVATAVDYEDNLIYVSVRSNDAVRIITSGP